MMPIFPVLSVALPVNRIRLFTEVGQHVQMPQGILILQENKEARVSISPRSQLTGFCVQTQSQFPQPGVLSLFRSTYRY